MNDTGSRTSVNGPRRLTTGVLSRYSRRFRLLRILPDFWEILPSHNSGFGTKNSLLLSPLRINAAGAPWNIHVSASVTFLPSRLFVRVLDLTRTFTGTGFGSARQDTSSSTGYYPNSARRLAT